MESPIFLVMVNVADDEWVYKIDSRRKVVGRSRGVDIRTPEQYSRISRRHAELWSATNGIWLKDLGSRGGTLVNGLCLQRGDPVRIAIGDRIVLADVELVLTDYVSKLAEVMAEANISIGLAGVEVSSKTTLKLKSQHGDTMRLILSRLTPAELDIVLWMYRGYTSDAELGKTLFRSPNTVRTQVASIFDKLGVHSRTEIVTWLKRAASATSPTGSDSKIGYETTVWDGAPRSSDATAIIRRSRDGETPRPR
ncbi:MAG: FHA domain-containing protein [Planctomycetia bacterium]|nr:FHA domain-containing protein [Planctomycetia bacterium]